MEPGPRGMSDRLLDQLEHSAARRYGSERVSELAHARQCAELGEPLLWTYFG